MTEREGPVVPAGVGLARAMLLHHADALAPRVPLRRWAAVDDQVAMVAVEGCSQGLEQLGAHLARLQAYRIVGASA